MWNCPHEHWWSCMPVTDLLRGTAQLLGRSSSCNPSMGVAKAQRTRGLSSSYQSNFLRSYHNFTNLDQISSSESRLKNQFLNQTSASPINLKFKISTKHSFRIATKIQLHNLYKTSASKCWTNSSFKILPELQLQNLDQPLCSKSEQKFSFRTKRQLPNL